MKCPKCKAESPKDDLFCASCGSSLKEKPTPPSKTRLKKISLISGLVILGLVFFNFFYLQPRLTGKKYVNDFNQSFFAFHEEFKKLQEERIRLGALAYGEASEDQLLDQMLKIQSQAEKAYQELMNLYEAAEKIAASPKASLVSPVYAQKWAIDFLKGVIANTPLIGRIVGGFNSSCDHIRLGLYKAYHQTMAEGEEPDKEKIKALFKKAGFKKPEDVLTYDGKKLLQFYKTNRIDDPFINEQISIAKIAIKTGTAAVKGYFDGILLVTGVKSIDLAGDVMKQLGIPSDLKDFIKIGLGKKTAGEYLRGKIKDKFLNVFEQVLTPKEIEAVMKEDTEEIKRILKKVKENADKVGTTGEWEEVTLEELKKGLLALNKDLKNLQEEVSKTLGTEGTPYHQWPKETQREMAIKINAKDEPMIISAVTTSGALTPYLFPTGVWEILTTSAGNLPTLHQEVEKKPGEEISLVNLTAQIGQLAHLPPGVLAY